MWNFLLASAVIAFVFYVVKKRFMDNKLQNVWWELLLSVFVVYVVFTAGMTIFKTYSKTTNDLMSYRDDFKSCLNPEFRTNKAKAGLTTCTDADAHYEKTEMDLTWDRLHEMGFWKIIFGYSPSEIFVNLAESSYWTFVIVLTFFFVTLSMFVFGAKLYSKAKEPKFDWSKIQIRDKTVDTMPNCRPVGKNKEVCLPL